MESRLYSYNKTWISTGHNEKSQRKRRHTWAGNFCIIMQVDNYYSDYCKTVDYGMIFHPN